MKLRFLISHGQYSKGLFPTTYKVLIEARNNSAALPDSLHSIPGNLFIFTSLNTSAAFSSKRLFYAYWADLPALSATLDNLPLW